jgi:hypothetical protein
MKAATPGAAKQREAAATVLPAPFRMMPLSLLEVNVPPDRSAVSQVRAINPHNRATLSMAVLLLGVALGAGVLFAEGQVFWQEGGVVVCDSTWAIRQAAVSDDSGGVFVVWFDTRGENGSVRAQHVDRDGNPVWQKNGVFVGDGDPRDINQLSVLPDGRGGLIAVWQAGDDLTPLYRHQVTAQRVDATGTVRWDSSGVVVTRADSGSTYEVASVSDGRGGAIFGWMVVAWESTGVDSLVVQRIDSLGNHCWGNPGLVLATDSLLKTWPPPYMCSDSVGGACITWDGSKSYRQTIVQHIDSAGCLTWPGAGVLPFASHLSPIDIMRMPGGYMVAGVSSAGISAQRIDGQGQLLWGPDGIDVFRTTPGGYLGLIHVLLGPDGSSFVVWSESRDTTAVICAQFVDDSGERRWDSLGVEVGSTNDRGSRVFGCVAAGAGLVASWPRDSHGPNDWDVYAQHVDTAGRLLWGVPGLGIATDSGRQCWEPCVVTDSRQGAIITWGYSYFGGHVGLSVQRAGDVAGVAGPVLSPNVQSAIRIHPTLAGTAVEVFLRSPSEGVVIADALGRVVRVLPSLLGDQRAVWDLRDANGTRVPAGLYVIRRGESGTSVGKVVIVNP